MSQGSPQLHCAQEVKHEKRVLPRLREVLGDMLEYPAPKPRHSHNRYNDHRIASSSYPSTSQVVTAIQSPQLPPIQPAMAQSPEKEREVMKPSPPSSHLSPTGGNVRECQAERASPLGDSTREEHPHTPRSGPTHSYDVFLLTSQQELSHKRSSAQDDHYEVTKEIAISSSSGKYSCRECGRRFQKNSTLKNHLTTHSGERPYECPDCRRTFSVSSNMRRHLERVHKSGGTLDK